jgi:hypothetical protein
MPEIDCPRCGARMAHGGVCPVCEIAHHAPDRPEAEPAAATLMGRLWQSGRLATVVAALCFAVGTLVPLVHVQRVHGVGARVAVSPLQMIAAEGPYGRELKSAVLLALPGAAFGLLSFLGSRRTRSVMVASRPLLLVVALIAAGAAALPVLKLHKHHRFDVAPGLGMAFVALGVVAGIVAALQFGRGVPEAPRRTRELDED